MPKTKPRKFNGFAAIDRRGHLVWGSTRTTPEDAKQFFDTHNPDPTGEGLEDEIWHAEIYLTKKSE